MQEIKSPHCISKDIQVLCRHKYQEFEMLPKHYNVTNRNLIMYGRSF